MAVADELVTILGVDVAKDAMAKLDSFKRGVEGISKSLLGLATVVTGFAAAAGLMVKGAADEAMALQTVSDKTGLSTDALQEWSYAAGQVGASSTAVQGDLAKLQEKFAVTGKDAEKTLLSLADRMKGMSGAKANVLGKSLGLSDDTIALLKRGRDGIEELRKEAHALGGIIPAESIKRAADFKRQMAELQFAFHGVTSQVAIAMIPALSRVVDLFKGWIVKNREWLSLGLAALMGGIVAGFEGFWNILKKIASAFDPLIDAIKPFLGDLETMEVVAHLVKGALSGLLLIFAPLIAKIALIGAGVAIAAIILEDLFSSVTTGEGRIARLYQRFNELYPGVGKTVKAVKDFIVNNLDLLKSVGKGIAILLGMKLAINGVFGATSLLTGGIKALMTAITANPIGLLVKAMVIAAVLIIDNWETVKAFFLDLWEGIQAKAQAVADAFREAWQGVKDWFFGLWEGALDIFPDFGEWAGKAANSIRSILGGALDWIKKQLARLTDWLPDWVKDKLGINSGGSESAGGTIPYSTPGRPAQVAMAASHGQGGTQVNDNKTVNIHVSSPDAQQAGYAAASAIQYGQPVATPGVYGPVAG